MAHVCRQGDDALEVLRLAADTALELPGRAGEPLRRLPGGEPAAAPAAAGIARAILRGRAEPNGTVFDLIAPARAGVLINGSPLVGLLGIQTLGHKDVIRVGETTYCFVAEDPACVEPFPGPEGVVCPRCKVKLAKDEPAVRCPACKAWHHEKSDGKQCWSYTDRCATKGCPQPTTLDGAFSWLPQEGMLA